MTDAKKGTNTFNWLTFTYIRPEIFRRKKNLERKLNIYKELDIGQSNLTAFQAHFNDFPRSESPEITQQFDFIT